MENKNINNNYLQNSDEKKKIIQNSFISIEEKKNSDYKLSNKNSYVKINSNITKRNIQLLKYPSFGTIGNGFQLGSKSNKNYFLSFTNFKEILPKINNNAILTYTTFKNNDLENFHFSIIIKSLDMKEQIKIVIDLDSIEKIYLGENNYEKFINKKENHFDQIIYFLLEKPPKVYYKLENNKDINFSTSEHEGDMEYHFMNKEFYFNNFKKILTKYSYINKYKFSDKNIIEFEHQKNNNNYFFNIDDYTKFTEKNYIDQGFIRLDSFLSQKTEFLNFYLLNLIMKINLRFLNLKEYYDVMNRQLKLREKIQNGDFKKIIENLYDESQFIYYPNSTLITFFEQKIKEYQNNFYLKVLNFNFVLQFSIFSLITNKKLFIINNELNELINYIENLNYDDQELMSKVIDKVNEDSLITKYTEKLSEIIINKFKEIKNNPSLNYNQYDNDDSISLIRSIEITPSIIYYKLPKFERNNQLIRKYSSYANNFIKINMIDENFNKIYFISNPYSKFLNFLNSLMKNGILVGSRFFNYITSSNTQAKTGSGWYFNLEGTNYNSIENIMNELGNFNNEKNKYKNIARRGQCASSSTPIDDLKPENIIEIEEILSPCGKYIYSDGIGQISLNLAKKCFDKLKKNKTAYSSAFQIRLSGIKGVVAINPELDGEKICIRPSMKKFDCENFELGIVKRSNYSVGYLNRQIIILLYSLGVDKSIFINMLKDQLYNLENVLSSFQENKIKNRKHFNLLKNDKKLSEELLSKCYYFKPFIDNYLKYGDEFIFNNEPLINELLLTIITSNIKNLKSKGKILDNFSCNLIGVIDEYGVLEHNEVFIQINKTYFNFNNYKTHNNNNNNKYFFDYENNEIIEGEVFVTKNPCLHPGDIRNLTAVNRKNVVNKLSHLINVIVFSQKGEKNQPPVQNLISGGDLDGDCYYVSWNKNIINKMKIKNYPNLKDMKSTNLNQSAILDKSELDINDIIKSRINTMKNDVVPILCNYYLAFADKDIKNGAFNQKCLEISKLFMIAIDSNKNGNFISQNILKEKNLILNVYPDFLEIDTFSYDSPGILGCLYRMCNLNKFYDTHFYNEYKLTYLKDYLMDIKLITKNSINYAYDMFKMYVEYSHDINNLLLNYHINFEAELFLNLDLYDVKNNKKIKENPTFKDIESLQIKYSQKIKENFKKINNDIASACYLATYLNYKSYNYYNFSFDKNVNGKKFIKEWNKFNNIKFEDEKIKYCDYEKISPRDVLKANLKKYFSFPWIIKDIREMLFKIMN